MLKSLFNPIHKDLERVGHLLAITWLISGELECKPKCDWVPRPHLLLPQIHHQCTELLHLLQWGWDRSHRTGSTLQASIVYYKHVSLFLIFILFFNFVSMSQNFWSNLGCVWARELCRSEKQKTVTGRVIARSLHGSDQGFWPYFTIYK